jgi:undecaprenyl-diphosphatase
MRVLAGLRDADRVLTQQAASRIPPTAGKVAAADRWRRRTAAAAGVGAMALAQIVSNGLGKQLADRPRTPKEWFAHDEVASCARYTSRMPRGRPRSRMIAPFLSHCTSW